MRILIRSRAVVVTPALRGQVEQHLGLTFGRFASRIDRVTVQFSRSDAGNRCAIEASLHTPKVRAEDTDADLFAVVNRLADRLSRAIDRALELENTHPTDPIVSRRARRRTTTVKERK